MVLPHLCAGCSVRVLALQRLQDWQVVVQQQQVAFNLKKTPVLPLSHLHFTQFIILQANFCFMLNCYANHLLWWTHSGKDDKKTMKGTNPKVYFQALIMHLEAVRQQAGKKKQVAEMSKIQKQSRRSRIHMEQYQAARKRRELNPRTKEEKTKRMQAWQQRQSGRGIKRVGVMRHSIATEKSEFQLGYIKENATNSC